MALQSIDEGVVAVLTEYGIPQDQSSVDILTSGLINKTWRVAAGDKIYILQRINHLVFKNPQHVAGNIRMIADYLAEHYPGYIFTAPVKTLEQKDMIHDPVGGYYRLFPFIHGSHTIDVVQTPTQAYEAAKQFGQFTKVLSAFDATKLETTIPDFHNLTLRYKQFEHALKNGNKDRIKESIHLTKIIQDHRGLLDTFEALRHNSKVKKRVTHHDTKISNVLFDHNNKGICVIDLDTVMPGYFISDVGDMMRTYLSPANEEERDFSKIEIRDDFFAAIIQGYVGAMREELSTNETDLILYSGAFLIYMQAIRFLADYFNNDVYYGIRYPQQNFARAGNQLALLKAIGDKKMKLQEIIARELKS